MLSLRDYINESCNITEDDFTNKILEECFGYNYVAPHKNGYVKITFKPSGYRGLFEDAKLECKEENLVEAIKSLLKSKGFDNVDVEASVIDKNMGGTIISAKFEQK